MADLTAFIEGRLAGTVTATGPDAHAKNYSLLLDGSDVHLAPLYDVISFLPYAQRDLLDLRTAMAFGSDHSVGAMAAPDAWGNAARQLGLDPAEVTDRAHDLLRRTPSAVIDVIDDLPDEDRASRTLIPLQRSAQTLATRLLKGLRPQGH